MYQRAGRSVPGLSPGTSLPVQRIVVRPFGPKQIEIVVPEADEQAIAAIKERITTGGMLQFLIVASELRDGMLFEQARLQAESPVQEERNRRDVLDDDGNKIGFWATVGREVADDPRAVERRVGREPPEVGAGAEDPVPGTGQDHRANVVVVADAPHRVDELAEHLAGERVALLGPVQGHGGDPAGHVVEELLVGHAQAVPKTAAAA